MPRQLSVFLAALLGLTLGHSALAQAPPPLAERLALCAGCHNADGNSTIPENPNLAGLDASYIKRQLNDFKAGKRKSPAMGAIVGMIDTKEFSALAEFFSEQKPKPPPKGDEAKLAYGKDIYNEGITASAVPSCSGCHNEDGSGTDKYPRLSGQHLTYVVQQLKGFKTGERDNDERGVMRAVAKRLTDSQIESVAQYIAILKEGEK